MTCKLGALITSTTAADRDLLTRWCKDGTDLRGRRVSAAALSHALLESRQVIGPTTLKDHRGGRCACYRKAER